MLKAKKLKAIDRKRELMIMNGNCLGGSRFLFYDQRYHKRKALLFAIFAE